jgi:hypothetical protein
MQMPDMSQYLNEMLAYWGPMMDVATERAQALPEREAMAFDQYRRRGRLDLQQAEEDILDQQLERKMKKQGWKSSRIAGPARSMSRPVDPSMRIGGSGMGKMMAAKDRLDFMPRVSTGGIGGTESWRNIPAAAAMTGINLPRSGFDVYADIAQAGRLPSRR